MKVFRRSRPRSSEQLPAQTQPCIYPTASVQRQPGKAASVPLHMPDDVLTRSMHIARRIESHCLDSKYSEVGQCVQMGIDDE